MSVNVLDTIKYMISICNRFATHGGEKVAKLSVVDKIVKR